MNNWLKYYYNINLEEIVEKNNYKIIIDNQNCFFALYPYNKDKFDIEYINNIQNIIKKISNNYYIIKPNNEHKLTSILDNKEYFLMVIKGLINDEISPKEFITNLSLYINYYPKNRANWEELWSKKIDYMEYQIAELSKNKKETIASFSFFSGLAENAISFLNINNIDYQKAHVSLVHTRMAYPLVAFEYYNSLNILIDYLVRDLAEYIKVKFMHGQDVNKDIELFINNPLLNGDDLKLFYGRLMFPTTYFDCVESILLSEKNEQELDSYIELSNDYLLMLKDTYYEIIKKTSLIIPDWLKNQL
jgi:hypothetical protein